MCDLQVSIIEFDEIWAYVGKKQRRTVEGETDKGDQYTFTALDAIGKAIISYRTGKRNAENTQEFAQDVRNRVINRPQITSDGFEPYVDAVERAFGADVDYAMLVKVYKAEPATQSGHNVKPKTRHSIRGLQPDQAFPQNSFGLT